jgi:host factor-I protein
MYQQTAHKRTTGLFEETNSRNTYGGIEPLSGDNRRMFKNANLQEIFLNNCRKNENTVHIELIRGEKRTGKIIGFDSQSVILSSMETQFLIYKSAIAAVIPDKPVQYIFNELHKQDDYETCE